MKISIVVATFNGEKYLQEQLNSFINQTVLPDEIIISDDGSTDSTMLLLKEFKKSCSCSICIVENICNHGVTGNFENAAKLATGDIVFFSDQDDVWYPNKIEETIKVFDKYPDCVGVVSDADCVDVNLKKLDVTFNDGAWPQFKQLSYNEDNCFLLFHEVMLETVIKGNILGGCCLALRNSYLRMMFPFCPSIYHDDWLCFCMFVLGDVVALNKSLFAYRIHGNNTVGFESINSNKKGVSKKLKKAWRRIKLSENCFTSNAERAIYFNQFAAKQGIQDNIGLYYQRKINVERLEAAISSKIDGVKALKKVEKEVHMYRSIDYYLEVCYILLNSKKKRTNRLNHYLLELQR